MHLTVTDRSVEFYYGSVLAGRYVYVDPFKPHLHPLNTPAGFTVSLRSPHDHPHHKGLMYALRTSDVNFWEEYATTEREKVGRQRHEAVLHIIDEGERVGFTERLDWSAVDGALSTFEETRTLNCGFHTGDRSYFYWEWSTELVAKRNLTLITSQWSIPDATGRPINYHGLGLRFRRDFGCTGGNQLLLDNESVTFKKALGCQPREVTFIGTFDETYPAKRAGVSVAPAANHGLFVLESPFAFLSFGPTALGSRQLAPGDRLTDSYSISVFDIPES
jgi:Methane oxygenase PmoA